MLIFYFFIVILQDFQKKISIQTNHVIRKYLLIIYLIINKIKIIFTYIQKIMV